MCKDILTSIYPDTVKFSLKYSSDAVYAPDWKGGDELHDSFSLGRDILKLNVSKLLYIASKYQVEGLDK
jgi:hypothetical protein